MIDAFKLIKFRDLEFPYQLIEANEQATNSDRHIVILETLKEKNLSHKSNIRIFTLKS